MAIEYEETEYTVEHKIEQEVRTRPLPVSYIHTETEIKYYADEEERYTTNYEVKYHPDTVTRYDFIPRTIYDSYTETHYRDVPY